MIEHINKLNNNCWIISNDDIKENIDSHWFDDKYWLNQGRLLGASSGRGSAWMVKSDEEKMMLRHYYRGGVPAHFIKDKYLWTGLNNTRGFEEYRLLAKMIELGLPVPAPIAAQVCRTGIFYQANILIKYLSHESTFAGLLNIESDINVWKSVGTTIAQFHNHGIFHADLNANNILIDGEDVYLIDFDHSGQRTPRKMWQQANIKRLKRSIDKLTLTENNAKNENNWQQLKQSYQMSINT